MKRRKNLKANRPRVVRLPQSVMEHQKGFKYEQEPILMGLFVPPAAAVFVNAQPGIQKPLVG